MKEPKTYWVKLLNKYLVEGNYVSIEGYPSIKEQQKMATEEKVRIDMQIEALGEKGLSEKDLILEKAIEFNERSPPSSMLTSVEIPSINSINFHNIVRYRTDLDERHKIDLSKSPVYTYFDHVKSNFVYVSVIFISLP